MAWFESHLNGGGGGGDSSVTSLLNNYAIGLSSSLATHSPIDANNYVEIVDDNVILHRNTGTPSLWIYTPYIETGKTYAFIYETFSGSDGYTYRDFTNTIPDTGDFAVSRIGSVVSTGGFSFTPTTSGYYAFIFWAGGGTEITVKNPKLVEFN